MSALPKERAAPQSHNQYSSVSSKAGPKKPCHFNLIGKCLKGASCPFSHSTPNKDAPAPIPSVPPTAFYENHDDLVSTRLGELSLESPGQNMPTIRSYNGAVGPLGSASHIISSRSQSQPRVPVPALFSIRLGLSSSPPKRQELCIFAMTGKCKFGLLCRSVHGIQCPRCLKFCLHPDDLDQNEEHIQQCLENPQSSALETEDEKNIECGICCEPVLSRNDPRFGLLSCEHAFCINCIRSWRARYATDAANMRSCPLCRVITYFVVPSSVWVSDPEEKDAIIETYKKKLSDIPCKHYAHGINSCPFGTSCFYAHAGDDGTPDRPSVRTVVNCNEKVTICREARLSDFIVFKKKQ